MREQSKHVGFRLPPSIAKELTHRAGFHRLSSGEYARLLVVDALSGSTGHDSDRTLTEIATLRAELKEVSLAVSELRKDLALACIALLAHAGKATEEKAREWVKATLKV